MIKCRNNIFLNKLLNFFQIIITFGSNEEQGNDFYYTKIQNQKSNLI